MFNTTTRGPGRVLLAAGTAAAALFSAAAARAEPALWAIKDQDSTIYLFGTVHALKTGAAWRSPKVDKALTESSELVVEVQGMDDQAKLGQAMMTAGIDPSRPLSQRLPPADRPRLAAAAAAIGAPPQALEPMEPWFAAMLLAIAPLMKAGYDPQSGVELKLLAEAKQAGKTISGLETIDDQIGFFDKLPEEVQVKLLQATLDDVAEAEAMLGRMVTAWEAGDLQSLEAEFVTEMKRDYPEVYEAIIVKRNEAWADELKAKLAGSGVSFVAVGAGHLVGPDRLQVELAKRGVKVERR